MDIIKRLHIIGLAATLTSSLYSSSLLAGTMGESYTPTFRPIPSGLIGYADINAPVSSTFYDSDDVFAYRNSDSNQDTLVGGIFVGLEYAYHPNILLQLGIDYSYFGAVDVNGTHTVGVEPSTSTLYQYNYKFQTQQLLIASKLLTSVRGNMHPYLFAGIGIAFNDSYDHHTSTLETCNINLTPGFDNKAQNSFSYSVGLGLDYDIYENIRLGLGYRFSDFGKAYLGHGQVTFNGYQVPFPYQLGTHSPYAHQVVAQFTYLM